MNIGQPNERSTQGNTYIPKHCWKYGWIA